MKNYLITSICCLCFITNSLSQNIVVLDFETRNGEENHITRKLTHEFEEALSIKNKYNILEQRDKDRLYALIQDLKSTQDLLNLSSENLENLKKLEIQMVVFGEYFDDIESGEINIKVTFQELSGKKVFIRSTLIRRGLINDQRTRRLKMKELVDSIIPTQQDETITSSPRRNYDVNEKPVYSIEDLKSEDIVVNVDVSDFRLGPRIYINLPEGIEGYEIHYSLDNFEYKEFDSGYNVLGKLKEDVLYIKLVSTTDKKEVGPFERKGLFIPKLQDKLSDLVKRNPKKYVDCSLMGCDVDRYELCNSMASKITFGREKDKEEAYYDLIACEGPEVKYGANCLAFPYEMFPVKPNDIIYCNIVYEDGYKIPFEVGVSTNFYAGKNNSTNSLWVELKPTDSKDMQNHPYAAALLTYGGNRSRKVFEIFLGAGGCSWSVDNKEVATFLYDIDGNGLVEAHANNPFSIPKPSRDKISIAIDLHNGDRIGPFTYDFNIEKVIQGAVHGAKPPRLECTYHGGDWHCRAPGTYGVILSWVNVKKITYGNDRNKLNNEVIVNLKEEDILDYAVSRGKSEKAFKFDIPEDWQNVFYIIEFIDGSTSEILRVPIRKY